MPSRIRIVVMALAASCGAVDELPPAELGEVCGEAGPVRVLELPPGELLGGPVRKIGERVLLYTAKFRAPDIAGMRPVPEERVLWSFGPCGEDPVRIDTTAGYVLEIPRWPGLALGQPSEGGEIVTVDLTGERASHVAFAGVGTNGFSFTTHGLVSFEDDDDQTMRVLLHPYPEDPWSDTVTGDVVIELVSHDREVIGDELFVRTLDYSLVRVALPGGEVSEEIADVDGFDISSDGRWLLWQSSVGVPEDVVGGAVILRDRESGVDTALGVASLSATFGPFRFVGDDLLAVNYESGEINDGVMRVYTLPGLEYVELPRGRALFGTVSDGRWLIGTWGEQTFDLFDPETASVTPLVKRGRMMWLGDGELELLDVPEHMVPESELDEEGPLYRVSFTGAAQQVAERATIFSRRLADGRRFTGLDLDERLVGQLVLHGPDAGSAALVDERVFADSMHITDAFGGEAVVYSVDDEARTGVYVTRPGGE